MLIPALVDDPDVARIQATVIQDGVVYRILVKSTPRQLFINDGSGLRAQLTDGDGRCRRRSCDFGIGSAEFDHAPRRERANSIAASGRNGDKSTVTT